MEFQLSTAAFFGLSNSQTLRISGDIRGHKITMLVDSGSTHNILQPRVAEFLQLPVLSIPSFPVIVGNGESINCQGRSPNVPVRLCNQKFSIPFLVLPIQGADLVLGVQWLSTLGPIVADFSVPSMKFEYKGEPVHLIGEPVLTRATTNQIGRMMQTGAIMSLHAVFPEPTHLQITTPRENQAEHPPNISALLAEYQPLFQPPSTLPPSRPHDHHIHLNPNTKPINVKPYRYPHHQKNIMTQLIQEMLKDGIIRPSHSPYSSPVLLVRKKDGT